MTARSAILLPVAALALILAPWSAAAQENPFQIALVGPTIQLVDDDEDIRGIRLNILYGVNENVSGLDFGLINHTNGDMTGFELGAVNVTDGDFYGWQAGLVNLIQGDLTGIQFSGGAIANLAAGVEGAQIAWGFNRASAIRGFQLSLVNVADDMHGIQVGLINIIRSKRDFPVLPLVNWKFD